ncbi:MAG: hypothetical protein CHACPFDD_02493 [Phycisphaerae bacterium]|nr:hypothetical protein [Phycisphaerae bacterium]
MLHKARENRDVALLLEGWEHFDAVANRAYYAVYHAGWAFLARRNRGVPDFDGRRYWRHSQIMDELEDSGMSPYSDWQGDWDFLRRQREKADYSDDSVSAQAARRLMTATARLVSWCESEIGD